MSSTTHTPAAAQAAEFNPAAHLHPEGAPARSAPILVAGARGMVGSAQARRLKAGGYAEVLAPGRADLNLMNTAAVHAYLAQHQPAYIFIAAAKVGGIQANNTYRGEFLYQSLTIQNNLIYGSHLSGVQQLMGPHLLA